MLQQMMQMKQLEQDKTNQLNGGSSTSFGNLRDPDEFIKNLETGIFEIIKKTQMANFNQNLSTEAETHNTNKVDHPTTNGFYSESQKSQTNQQNVLPNGGSSGISLGNQVLRSSYISSLKSLIKRQFKTGASKVKQFQSPRDRNMSLKAKNGGLLSPAADQNRQMMSSPQHNHTLAYPLSAAKDFFSHRGSVTVRKPLPLNQLNETEVIRSPDKNPLDQLNDTIDGALPLKPHQQQL